MQAEAPPLLDQVVVVTGAASGIGRGVALAAAARGARVVAIDLSQAGLAETAALAQPSRVEW
ncbi:MAG: SDR family NAD(P)-dependent oxidoreductase, partial [Candidatus Dormibacteraceae bacterium]